MAEQKTDKGFSRLGAAAMGLGGVTIAGFSRAPWMEVDYFDDRVGGGARLLSGAEWSAEATAVALLLIVAMIAAFALRRTPRRIVGAIAAFAALGAALSPLLLLVGGADLERVRVLVSAGSTDIQVPAESISGWAEITSVSINTLNPVLTLVGCVLAAVGGIMVAWKPGQDSAKLNKYEKDAVRREKIGGDLEENPDSGRVMWDALDADIDPTESAGPAGTDRS